VKFAISLSYRANQEIQLKLMKALGYSAAVEMRCGRLSYEAHIIRALTAFNSSMLGPVGRQDTQALPASAPPFPRGQNNERFMRLTRRRDACFKSGLLAEGLAKRLLRSSQFKLS
jgi:hypothetical protein